MGGPQSQRATGSKMDTASLNRVASGAGWMMRRGRSNAAHMLIQSTSPCYRGSVSMSVLRSDAQSLDGAVGMECQKTITQFVGNYGGTCCKKITNNATEIQNHLLQLMSYLMKT